MCGIVGYVGQKPATPVLIDGLRRLEYRGYDSSGVALVNDDGSLWLHKEVGRVQNMASSIKEEPLSQTGIAHTRWATHGGVTRENAHPHLDAMGQIAVVHNGIIENMSALRLSLEAEGVRFLSETDTEVLPHLIRRHYRGDALAAVCDALREVRGTYGMAVIFADSPEMLIAVRNGSPLVIGVGDDESVLASDPQAIVAHTRRAIYMQDREIAVIRAGDVQMHQLDGRSVASAFEQLSEEYVAAELEGFPHFMLKEIHEQPQSIERAIRGRIHAEEGNAKLGGLNMSPRDLVAIGSVTNLGCGTAYHAGLIGALAIESLARVPARAVIASEFRYSRPIISQDGLFFAVSQSGETADTLGAVEEVLLKGGQVRGVVNVVGSTIARSCKAGVYIHAGPEIAVASTKAFTSQVTALMVFTLMLARTRNISLKEGQDFGQELMNIPSKVTRYLENPGPIDQAVRELASARYALFLGRGFAFPVALEGALKLKEIAYIPCEAYPAGEMKHGPIAMLEPDTPVVFVCPAGEQREKAISNMKEVEARGAKLIVIHTEGDEEVAALAHISIPIPETHEVLSPLLAVLPLQLIAYRAALLLGFDVDKPRNLAKSVTVE